jgi:hypothetical protein
MAFWQSIWTICYDVRLDAAAKVAMARQSGDQMIEALCGWIEAYAGLQAGEDVPDDDAGKEQMAARSHLYVATKTTGYLFDVMTATAAEQKAGAVLSAQNRTTIAKCIAQLQALLDAATSATTTSAARHVVEEKTPPALATEDSAASGDSHADADEDDMDDMDDVTALEQLLASMHSLRE